MNNLKMQKALATDYADYTDSVLSLTAVSGLPYTVHPIERQRWPGATNNQCNLRNLWLINLKRQKALATDYADYTDSVLSLTAVSGLPYTVHPFERQRGLGATNNQCNLRNLWPKLFAVLSLVLVMFVLAGLASAQTRTPKANTTSARVVTITLVRWPYT